MIKLEKCRLIRQYQDPVILVNTLNTNDETFFYAVHPRKEALNILKFTNPARSLAGKSPWTLIELSDAATWKNPKTGQQIFN